MIGENKLSFLNEKLKAPLEDWKGVPKPYGLSGNKVFWILTLGEEGSTISIILASESNSKLNLYFVDENSNVIDIIELSDDEIQNWLHLLKI